MSSNSIPTASIAAFSPKVERRAVLALAGAALVAGTAIGGPVGASDDPIFAAIEEHRAAFHDHLELMTNVPNDEDDLICDGPEYDSSYERTEAAAVALASIRPTTIDGVVALLAYVHEFNIGSVRCTRQQSCYSEHIFWPTVLTDDDVKCPRGKALSLPFPYWVMENVRAALVEVVRA